MLRFLTSGESHGKCLMVTIEGLPSGLPIRPAALRKALDRRRNSFGRSPRMTLEGEQFDVVSGVESEVTTGAPVSVIIENVDYRPERKGEWSVPRPGHADLPGLLKYRLKDSYMIAERASARETATRVMAGAIAEALLGELGISVLAHVVDIGGESLSPESRISEESFEGAAAEERFMALRAEIEKSPLFTVEQEAAERMIAVIESAREAGDSLGGCFEVLVRGVMPGLGTHVHWDRRLDGLLAQSLMSIPSVKGVEIGEAISASQERGSKVHDEIFHDAARGYYRRTNRCGGIEGGMSNGSTIIARAFVKPIPTILAGLDSHDIISGKPSRTVYSRADTCVVPAASVVGQSMVSWTLAVELLNKFGGDDIDAIRDAVLRYRERILG